MALILIRYILGIMGFVILIMYILLGLVGDGLGKGKGFRNHKSPLMASELPIIIGNV